MLALLDGVDTLVQCEGVSCATVPLLRLGRFPRLRLACGLKKPYLIPKADVAMAISVKLTSFGQIQFWIPRGRHIRCRGGLDFLASIRLVEGRVKSETAFSLCRFLQLELKKLARLLLRNIIWRQLEPASFGVRRIAREHTPQRTLCRDLIKPRSNELTADALALARWRDRNRA